MKNFAFFDQFTPEQKKVQLTANIEQLKRMQLKADKTGKKINGFTSVQLSENISKLEYTLKNV